MMDINFVGNNTWFWKLDGIYKGIDPQAIASDGTTTDMYQYLEYKQGPLVRVRRSGNMLTIADLTLVLLFTLFILLIYTSGKWLPVFIILKDYAYQGISFALSAYSPKPVLHSFSLVVHSGY